MADNPSVDRKMNELSIIVGGDIAFNGDINTKLRGRDPFEFVKDEIANSDISLANLECILSNKGEPTSAWANIRSNPSSAKYLRIFRILCLANNHILDYGPYGLNETIDVLNKNGILSLGAGNGFHQAIHPLVIERDAIRIGLINFVASSTKSRTLRARAGHGYVKLDQQDTLKNTCSIIYEN